MARLRPGVWRFQATTEAVAPPARTDVAPATT
jgi:hypothetical protein